MKIRPPFASEYGDVTYPFVIVWVSMIVMSDQDPVYCFPLT